MLPLVCLLAAARSLFVCTIDNLICEVIYPSERRYLELSHPITSARNPSKNIYEKSLEGHPGPRRDPGRPPPLRPCGRPCGRLYLYFILALSQLLPYMPIYHHDLVILIVFVVLVVPLDAPHHIFNLPGMIPDVAIQK